MHLLTRKRPIDAISRVLMATAALAVGLLTSAAQGQYERWYKIEFGGAHAGWMHTTEARGAQGIVTSSSMLVKVRRDQDEVSIKYTIEFVETPEGKPVSMKNIAQLGQSPEETTTTFAVDHAEVKRKTPQGEAVTREALPEGKWLTPASADEYVKRRLLAGAAEITVRGIDPTTGLTPVAITRAVAGKEKRTVLGREVELYKCTTTQDFGLAKIVMTEYLDENGRPVLLEMPFMDGQMRFEVSTREVATASFRAPELLVDTFVKPDRAVTNSRLTTNATYLLTFDSDAPDLPVTAAQSVERIDARTLRVTVDTSGASPDAAADAKAWLGSTALIDKDNEWVTRLVEQALRSAGPSKPARAELLRRAVRRHITDKSLGVLFASASEVARTKRGDCSEHAVLLAAMLRSDGIPARVASGLIYADSFAGSKDVFAYHMWTQALVDDGEGPYWRDLDATLPDRVTLDATHIALLLTGLPDTEGMSSMAQLLNVLGRVEIKVESYR